MRKFWGSLLLALSLLVSQQGELLHELSHLVEAATAWPAAEAVAAARTGNGPSKAAHSVCDTCLAFSHLATAVHTAVFAAPVLATADHWVVAERFLRRSADAPPASARDPPAVG